MKNLFLSIVIPAYNESRNVETVVEELRAVIHRAPSVKDYEIILVDDHSSDDTYARAAALHERDARVRAIRLSRRGGSYSALRVGIAHARGSVTLCISADGQDDPHVLPTLLAKAGEGVDVVWAVREKRKDPFWINLFHSLARRIIAMIAAPASGLDLVNADFFLLSRKVTEAVNRCPERNTSLVGLLMWLGFRQGVVRYERRPRYEGSSKWTLRAKWRFFQDWVIAFSGFPLKIISVLGILMSGLGFLYAVFIVIYRLMGYGRVEGWAEIVTLILVIGGVQMLMLGITGEYLWRNLEESRNRPLYFIEEATEGDR